MNIRRKLENRDEKFRILDKLLNSLTDLTEEKKKHEFSLPAGVVLAETKDEAIKRKQYEDIAKSGKLPASLMNNEVVEDTVKNIVSNIYNDKLRGLL